MSAVLFREQSVNRREEDRFRVRFGAMWLDYGPNAHEFTVLEVSASGFLIETDQHLPANASIIVELPDSVAKICRVVWASGKFHGATFSEPLSVSELQRLIAASPDVWPNLEDDSPPAPLASLTSSPHHHREDYEPDSDEKLPLVIRARIIAGSATFLWAVIGSVVWLAV